MAKKKSLGDITVGGDELRKIKIRSEEEEILKELTEDTKKRRLPGKPLDNLRHEKFARLYATDVEFFGNGVQTYIEVYKPDQTKKNWYETARSDASQLLTNTNLLARVNELLEATGLNDAHVDKQLYFLLTQNADLKAKGTGIQEYNKLKKRVTDKLEVTVKTMTYAEILKDAKEHPEKYGNTLNAPESTQSDS